MALIRLLALLDLGVFHGGGAPYVIAATLALVITA